MKYNFVHKKSGAKSIENILSVDTPSPIIDFCCTKEGFFIVEENMSYNIDLNGDILFEKDFGANIIRSVCCFENDIYILTKNNGEVINIVTELEWIRGTEKNRFAKLFENLKEYKGHICCNNMYMAISIEELNKCFIFDINEMHRIIGNGKREYSLYSNILLSGISMPQGVALVQNDIFLSDYGNGCIRSFSNFNTNPSHKIVLGNLINKNIKANKLFIINKNLYHNNGDTIYQSSLNNGNLIPYFKNDKIKNMSLSHDGSRIITLLEC